MADVFTSRDDEDELIQYAYVPSDVRKTYAIRYRGYVSDLPHFFRKAISSEFRNDRGRNEEIVVYVTQDCAMKCRKGDWIVGLPNGDYDVLADDVFLNQYQNFLLMMNADLSADRLNKKR